MTTQLVKGVFEYLRAGGEIRTKTEFGQRLGFGHSFASQLLGGKTTVPGDLEERIKEAFPNLDLELIKRTSLVTEAFSRVSNVKVLNRRRDLSRTPYTNKHGVYFEPLEDGQWLITYKHVPPAAHAAYTAGWGDPEYIESLPTRTTVVSEVTEDNYLSMTVTGSCQDDGTINGVPENMEVTGRSYTRSMWQYALPFAPAGGGKPLPKVKVGDKEIDLPTKNKRYRYWIVMDRHEGLQVVMIKSQDLEKGILHCTCRNPDKKKHPDFDIKLDDCSQLFFVTDRRIKE